MSEKPKKFSRRWQTVIGGELLKKADEYCATQCLTEPELLREALREKLLPKKNPFFNQEKKA